MVFLEFPEIVFNSSRMFNFFNTSLPLGDIDIPAPYSLIFEDLSKITHGKLFSLRKLPRAKPDIPAPIIATEFS